MSENHTKTLTENTYEPLNPGEAYEPAVAARKELPELTWRSVGWSVLLCVNFIIASAYSGLKIGQVIESVIPISIQVIGLARLCRRRSSVLEYMIVMAIAGMACTAVIALYIRLCWANLVPYPGQDPARVPRANIQFLPIKDARCSGSMNYVGRARTAEGMSKSEATFGIKASLKISVPEFEHLISHQVVPGQVMTFAYLQNLHMKKCAGFEATVLMTNTQAGKLLEGIADNAFLSAHGMTEVERLPDEELQIGALLALLQGDAKNQASYRTWGKRVGRRDVARIPRQEYLVAEERADKLSGAWGRHPLIVRMYLPAYRSGTERVAALRCRYEAKKILPALYGSKGIVDIESLESSMK